jgi:hypothetical protein
MLRTRLGGLAPAALSLLLVGAATTARAQDWQPLAVGDVRTYERGGAFGALQHERTEVQRRSGVWFRFDSFLGLPDTWVAFYRGDVFVWDGAAARAIKLFDLHAAVGQGYRVELTGLPGGWGTMTLGARDETVVVNAGTFRDCARFSFQTAPGVADAGWGSIWFAPGVGVVQWSENSFAGPVPHTLHTATIGGTAYPQPQPVRGGLTVALQADRFEYSLPPLLPVAMNHATFTFTIDNQTGTPIDITYPSGQSFDVELSDASGQVLARWSDGRFFTQALRQGTLQGTLTLTQGMALADRGGQPLRPGDYKARMWLTTLGGPVFEASTLIRVR